MTTENETDVVQGQNAESEAAESPALMQSS